MSSVRSATIEVCVESPAAARAAADAGAHRVELCSALAEGGLTPSEASIAMTVEKCHVPVMVLVRPRRGGFVYADEEIEIMRRDVARMARLGAAGVVVGALDGRGGIAVDAMRRVLDESGTLDVTFHRAFDAVATDWREAMDRLKELGILRVLSSGAAPTAPEGTARLREMRLHGEGEVTVMAGGGVRPDTIVPLLHATGVTELHFSASRTITDPLPRPDARIATRPRLDENEHEVTDPDVVRRAVEAVEEAAGR